MKKYFIMAVAVLASLTACQQEEPQTVVQTREICFAPAATETRATPAPIITTDNLSEFAVSGFIMADYTQPSNVTEIFKNTTVTKNNGNIFEASGADVKYWAESTDYMFSGVAPIAEAAKYAYSFDENSKEFTQTITGFEIKGDDKTSDLIVATPVSAEVAASTYTHEVVGLNFNHMLARVKFTFTNQFADDNVKLRISNLTLNAVPAKGNAVIEGGVPTWTSDASTVDVKFYDTLDEIIAEPTSADKTDGANVKETVYRYILSTKTAVSYTMSFHLDVLVDEQTALTKDYTNVALPETTFTNGKGQVFNANISGDLLEEELHPIQFTVTVTDWEDETPKDIDLSAN